MQVIADCCTKSHTLAVCFLSGRHMVLGRISAQFSLRLIGEPGVFNSSKKMVGVLVLVLASIAVHPASAGNPRPYKGKTKASFEPIDQVDNIITFQGLQIGQFLHFGLCRIESIHEFNEDTLTGAGTFKQRVASGATFQGTFEFTLISPTESVGTWEITPNSGTGRLVNLTGSGTLKGVNGTARYEGEVSY